MDLHLLFFSYYSDDNSEDKYSCKITFQDDGYIEECIDDKGMSVMRKPITETYIHTYRNEHKLFI